MITDFFYITLLVFAILAIQTSVLRNAIIYLSVFSLLCSAVYLFLGAPDVAIAEAVIGCTLSTILYLVALKKYRIFTVYYRCLAKDTEELTQLKLEKEDISEAIKAFANKTELQLDIINTTSSFREISTKTSFDIIIFHNPKGIWMHGLHNSYQYTEITRYLTENITIPIHTYYLHETDATIEENIINVTNHI